MVQIPLLKLFTNITLSVARGFHLCRLLISVKMNNIIRNTVLLAMSLLAAFLLGELVVRVFISEPIKPRFVIDSGYGVRANEPNISTVHAWPGEYEVTVSNNAAGMRGSKDYVQKKDRGVVRIALLGDSFVYGHGVNDNEVVSFILEQYLNESRSQTRYEVLNFGVSGFGQAEEFMTYRKLVRKYEPDLVVIFYFNNDVTNDAVSNLFDLAESGLLRETGNQYLPGVKARELLYSMAPVRFLFEHSQLWNMLRNRLSALVQNHLMKEKGFLFYDDKNEKAVELNQGILREFVRVIKQDGAQPVLFLIPDKEMVSNFSMSGNELKRMDLLVLDGAHILESTDYYEQDGHWRNSGHRKSAQALRKLIEPADS